MTGQDTMIHRIIFVNLMVKCLSFFRVYFLSLKKNIKDYSFVCKQPFKKSFNFVLNGDVTVYIILQANNVFFYKEHLILYTVHVHCCLLLV